MELSAPPCSGGGGLVSSLECVGLLDKVLVPLDGSLLADTILNQLGRLLRRPETAVRFVTVLSEATVEEAKARGVDPFAVSLKHLELHAQPLGKAPADASWDVYVGDAATRILDDAKLERATLIAMATHGRSGIERWIRGSVAERVLRSSPVPVLVSNPRGILSDIELHKILVPLDGSKISAGVLPHVRELALLYRAEVVLFHVIERRPAAYPAESLSLTPEAAEAFLGAADERHAGVKVRVRSVTGGAVAERVLEAATEEGANLVALTTHGRSGLSRWAYGSVAEQIVRHCPLPLLVKRATVGRTG